MTDYTGIVPVLDEQLYHAHPALSSTQARRLLESPAKYRHALTVPEAPKAAWDLGTAVHAKVLGVGAQTVVIPEDLLGANDAVSTKAAKDWIADARAAGQTPVKRAVADEVDAMTEAVLGHTMARTLLEQPGGTPEASVFSTDPDTDVAMRARFDYLATIAVDLKTARDASPAGFARASADHGYHVQRGHYLDALKFADGQMSDGFVFVVVENVAPYLVGVYRLNSEFEEIGERRARQARRIYRECLDTGVWPGYGDDIQSLMAPFWLVAEYQETAA